MISKCQLLYCVLVSVLGTIGLMACTSEDAFHIHYGGYEVPNPHKHFVLTNVTSYQQTTNYTCGPSAVMTLMRYYGKLNASDMNSQTEMRIAKEMNTSVSGTSQDAIVAWLIKNGFNVDSGQHITIDALINNINKGIPTIITWNDFSEHAIVVVGYNSEGETPSGNKDVIFAADPESGSYIEENGATITGVDSLTPDQLELNQANANFFNPSHSAIGTYITAVPR